MNTIDATGNKHDATGRFAGHVTSASAVDLGETGQSPDWRAQRAEALAGEGYVAPISTRTDIPAASVEDLERWWGQQFADAEYGHDTGDYPQMPDDNTPSMTGGRALSGNRRTHRMRYSGNGLDLRMPSKTAVHRYSAQIHHGTFDVPVSASLPDGRQVTGWVRCTKGVGHTWDTQALGFSGDAELHVAEGVAAVLEGQRARTSLAAAGDLAQRRRDRLAARDAAQAQAVDSSWIQSVGYSGESGGGMMVMRTRPYQRKDGSVTPGRTYGYQVDKATFAQLASSPRPGATFNQTIRGRTARLEVARCGRCGMYSANGAGHQCRVRATERSDAVSNRGAPRSWAARLMGRRSRRTNRA